MFNKPLIILVSVFSMILISCEGPTGETGPTGPTCIQGPPGMDGNSDKEVQHFVERK